MLFHEIYGKYYQTVAEILRRAGEQGSISQQEIRTLVSQRAFSESAMYIPEAVEESWYLLDAQGKSVLRHPPQTPLTLQEKRWLKAMLQDPRVRLFDLPEQGLEDVEPLFDQNIFCWFDRYEDGDPYGDPQYIQIFRQLIQAIREKRRVQLVYSGSRKTQTYCCTPCRLEYSEKDDKFRLLALHQEQPITLNVSRISSCTQLEERPGPLELPPLKKAKLVMELWDQRNALERAMLHFSHLEKETEQLDQERYRITLWYESGDERELMIRILSFGPVVKVLEPKSLVNQIRWRIQKQRSLHTERTE